MAAAPPPSPAAAADDFLPVLFTAAAGPVQLTCCVHAVGADRPQTDYELLVVDAAQSRGWSARFSVAAVNAALQDEELTASELGQVLAAVLPAQQAVTAQLQPGGALRLEAWCHRTQRVALLPPTHQQRRQPDSDYRQAAFAISLPVAADLARPQWMQEQRGAAFEPINTGLLAAMLHRDQLLQDSVLRLQSQLQLLYSHTAQLQALAESAVRTAVKGTAGLKDDPAKQQQQQHQQLGRSLSNKGSSSSAAAAAAAAGAGAGAADMMAGSQQPAFTQPATQAGLSRLGSQLGAPPSRSPVVAAAAVAPLASLLTFNPAGGLMVQRTGSSGGIGPGSSIPVQRAGSGGSSRAGGDGGGGRSGGSSRPSGVAQPSAAGRAHLARQSQDEKALRQLWGEQQGLSQEWQQQLQQLVAYQGPLEGYLQLLEAAGGEGVVAAGRHAVALPWHLREQQQEEQEGHDAGQQEQNHHHHQQQVGMAASQGVQDEATAAAGGAQLATQAELPAGVAAAAGTAPSATQDLQGLQHTQHPPPAAAVAVVAPVKQKQVAGHKRRAHEGQSLLKRQR